MNIVSPNKSTIAGAKGGGSQRSPVEAPNSLHSTSLARIIDLVSEGEIIGLRDGLKSIYLDETPLANADDTLNFKDVHVEVRSGTQDQSYIPGFSDVENEISVNVELRDNSSWTRALSNTNLDAFRVRLSVPALSKTNTANGDTNGHSVHYVIELSTDGGAFASVFSSSFSGKTNNKYERSHRVDLPRANTGWVVRVRRTTPNAADSYTVDKTFVDSFAEIIDAKLRYPNSALVGITVNAEQFQNVPSRAYDMLGRIIRVPSNYDVITRAYSGIWDGTFKASWTDNPAWIYYDLVTNPRYGLGHLIPEHQIDKWALYKIARYCDGMVPDGMGGQEPRFTCNLYLQTRADAYKVLSDLASVFRGIAYWAGGAITAVADMPEDPVFIYNAANVIDGRFVYQGSSRKDRYTVALVSWNDLSDMGRAKVEYVEDFEGIERYGVQQTEVTALGCTSRGQARRLGRWLLVTSRLETDSVTFAVGLDGAIAAPGQIIVVADELRAGKRIGGRIASATISSITADKLPDVKVGDTAHVVLPSGEAEARIISGISGNTLTFAVPLSAIPQAASAWAVESADLMAQRFRVVSVAQADGLTFSISAIRHIPGKHAHVELGTPLEMPNISQLPKKVQAPPTSVEVKAREIAGEVTSGTALSISWMAPEGATEYLVEWRQGKGAWQSAGKTAQTLFDVYNVPAGEFEAKVVAVNGLGNKSNPAYSAPFDIKDTTAKPGVIVDIEERLEELGEKIHFLEPEGLEELRQTVEDAVERVNEAHDTAQQAHDEAYSAAQEALENARRIAAERAAREAAIAEAELRIEQVLDDSVITPNEKPQLILDYNTLVNERPGIILEAEASEVDWEKYNQAIENLILYMSKLTVPVDWDDTSGITKIIVHEIQ